MCPQAIDLRRLVVVAIFKDFLHVLLDFLEEEGLFEDLNDGGALFGVLG